MAAEGEGGGTTTVSTIDAIEKLDTQIAKQKELLRLRQEDAVAMRDATAQLQIQTELREKELTQLSQKLSKAKDDEEIENAISGELRAQIELMEKAADTNFSSVEKRKIGLQLIAKQRAQLDLINQSSKQTEKFVGGLAGKLGIASKFSETTAGGMADMALNLAQSGKAGEILSKSLATTFNPLNLAASLLEKIVESIMLVAIGADKAASNFQRATGFSGEIQGDLIAISQAGVASGVSLEDAGKAMSSLTNNFSAFNPTATETNIELSNSITLLEKTGVSADQSAKTMDFFNKVMGESARASAVLTERLALAGTGIGITTSKMLSDFESVNGYLIGFGDRTTDVFLGLQAQAKATGVALSSLVGIAQKFDTFDGAANAVGSLNAALGTNLSTIDMLNMSTEQRISMLAQEIDFASGGFDNLDRYTQMYVAQAIGAKDAGEAQRLINLHRNPAELAKYNAKMQEQQARQEDLNQLTEEFVPVMEQFQIAVMALGTALSPIVEVVTFIISGFGKLIQGIVFLTNLIPGLTTILAGLLVVFVGYKIIKMINGTLATMAAVKAALVPPTVALAAAEQGLAVTQTELATVSKITGPIINKSSGQMSAGFIKLAPALFIAAGAILLIAVSFDLISRAAIALVHSFVELFNLFRDNLSIIPEMALVLGLFGTSFLLSGAMIFSGATLMAAAMIPLAAVFLGLGLMISPIERLGVGFTAMGTGIQMAVAGIAPLVAGLGQILELTDDDGFFAITTDGNTTSMVSAKGGTLTSFSSENITVDVKIPEINIPTPTVNVYIGQEKLNDLITRVVNKRLDGL